MEKAIEIPHDGEQNAYKRSNLLVNNQEIDINATDAVGSKENCPLCFEIFVNTKDFLKHVFMKHVCFECQINCQHQNGQLETNNQDDQVSVSNQESKDVCDQDDQSDENIEDYQYSKDQAFGNDQVTENNQINDQIQNEDQAKTNHQIPDSDQSAKTGDQDDQASQNCKGRKDDHCGKRESQNDTKRSCHKKNRNCEKGENDKKTVVGVQDDHQTKQCQHCQKHFQDDKEMKKHQEMVKSQQKRDMIYICDICQTSFFTVLCALYLHKETSHGDQNDQSDQSEQNDQNDQNERNDQRIDQRSDQVTRSNPGLKRNPQVLDQTKLKSNQCHECLKTLKSRSALEYHLDHVHSTKNQSKLENRRHKCDLCDKSYKDTSGLYNHVQSVHSKVTFKCDLCSRKMKSQGALYNHKKNIHMMVK